MEMTNAKATPLAVAVEALLVKLLEQHGPDAAGSPAALMLLEESARDEPRRIILLGMLEMLRALADGMEAWPETAALKDLLEQP